MERVIKLSRRKQGSTSFLKKEAKNFYLLATKPMDKGFLVLFSKKERAS